MVLSREVDNNFVLKFKERRDVCLVDVLGNGSLADRGCETRCVQVQSSQVRFGGMDDCEVHKA